MTVTVLEPYSVESTVNKSRFIGIVLPLDKEESVDNLLGEIMQKYPKATHYCYAYRYDSSERACDDGEPSRSAGFPLLQTLQYRSLNHVLLVVVRYYGGTKLGLGRLTRVYREMGENAVNGAQKAEVVPGLAVKVLSEYNEFDQLKYLANKAGIKFKPIEFGTSITIEIKGEEKQIESYLEIFRDDYILNKKYIDTYRRLEQ